jgi:hypothetical protein
MPFAVRAPIVHQLSGCRTPEKISTGFSQPRRGKDFSLFQNVQADSVAYSAFFLNGIKVLCCEDNVARL